MRLRIIIPGLKIIRETPISITKCRKIGKLNNPKAEGTYPWFQFWLESPGLQPGPQL